MKTKLFGSAVALACLMGTPVSTVPYIMIDQPHNNTSVGRTFTVHGTALNADTVHVWGFPSGQPAVFFGAASPTQVDTTRQLPTGRFSLLVQNAPVGVYPMVAYAHDPATGTFPSQAVFTIDVRACVNYAMLFSYYGPDGLVQLPSTFCGYE